MSSEVTGRALALKLPKGTLDYIKKNPRTAQLVGQAVATGLEMNMPGEVICKVLEKENVLAEIEKSTETGTLEDLHDFLAKVKEAVNAPIDLGIRTESDIKKVEEALGSERFAYTQVDSIEDTPKTKEG